jgi:hypothetical protein
MDSVGQRCFGQVPGVVAGKRRNVRPYRKVSGTAHSARAAVVDVDLRPACGIRAEIASFDDRVGVADRKHRINLPWTSLSMPPDIDQGETSNGPLGGEHALHEEARHIDVTV